MHTTLRQAIAALFAIAAIPGIGAHAQAVVVSEVRADAAERWVELHNRGPVAIDVSSWSLHYATRTPGMPKNYWWPLPVGTVMAPDSYLRVNWFQTGSNVPGTGELWTGTSPYGFLFGLGGETLLGTRGAFALVRSQNNSLMTTAAIIEDWVSWGENGYTRESLAIEVGLWSSGRHLPAIAVGTSLARDPQLVGNVAFADLAWFVDHSPTPLHANMTGAIVQSYGQACSLPGNHLLGLPTMRAESLPLLGNNEFALVVDNTTGIFGEFVLVGFGTAAAPVGTPSILPPYVGVPCHEAIDVQQLITTWLLPAQIVGTAVPLPLHLLPPSAVGLELHAQALVLDLLPNVFLPYQGLSNALRVVIGQ